MLILYEAKVFEEVSKKKVLAGLGALGALGAAAYGAKKVIDAGEEIARNVELEKAYKNRSFWDDFFGRPLNVKEPTLSEKLKAGIAYYTKKLMGEPEGIAWKAGEQAIK